MPLGVIITMCALSVPGRAPAVGLDGVSPRARAASAEQLATQTPRERLEALAEQQRLAPVEQVRGAPVPAGVGESLGQLPDPTAPGAADGLDAVLERYAALAIDPPPGPSAPEASEEDRFLAARLYVQARTKVLDADAAGAATDLERAIQLDPGAASLWLALGEACLRSGREADGIDAMRRAVALGLEHPRPLLLMASWEAARQQTEASIHHAVRAVRAPGMREDPSLEHMAWAALGDALRGGGHHRASAEAVARAFDLPEQFPGGTAYAAELSSMYRGASDALFQAARGAIAVADWELAARVLSLASRFQGVDDGRLLPPRVLACLRLGHPADAALAVLESIEEHGAATDPRTRRMIRHLRDHTDVGPALAAALTEIDARVRGQSPTLDAALARAIAAGVPDGLDRGPLFDAARRHPWDLDLTRDLLSSFGEHERALAVDAAVALASEHPAFAETIADAMVVQGVRTSETLEHLRSRPARPGGPLLLARLLMRQGAFAAAREELDRSEPAAGVELDADVRAARSALRISLLAASGDAPGARRLIDDWPTPRGDEQRLCLVRALVALNDAQAAREAAGEPTGRADPSAPDRPGAGEAARALLMQACQLARAQGDGVSAERLARRVLEVDPLAEPAYGILIALHSPGGPRADQSRLQEAVQALRQHLPTGALLRFLSAREFIQFGRLSDADARLRALALDAPDDENVLRSLLEVWAQRAAREGSGVLDEGQALLRRIAGEHPASLAPHVAEAMLAINRERFEEAVAPISAWLDRRLLTTAEDRNALRSVVEPLLRRATSSPNLRARAALLALWERMSGAGVPLDPPMHQARLVLLTQAPPFSDDEILRAAALAAEQVPGMGPAAFLAPVGRVVQGGRPDLGLVLLREAAARGGGLNASDSTRWAGLIAQFGDADDARDLLALTTDPATLAAMLPQLPGSPEVAPADPARMRGDIAYALAAATRILDRPSDVSEGFLVLTLEQFPGHESAANDLGYQWADRGVHLDEAERLLLIAHRAQPDDANVLDSLGWLRYKQGRLSDLTDDAGRVIEDGLGALTLLERAASLLPENSGPVTLDQLGDALWRVGRREDALARWRQALPRAEADAERLSSEDAPQGLRRESMARRDAIAAKIREAEAGGEPPIAPLGEGVAAAR